MPVLPEPRHVITSQTGSHFRVNTAEALSAAALDWFVSPELTTSSSAGFDALRGPELSRGSFKRCRQPPGRGHRNGFVSIINLVFEDGRQRSERGRLSLSGRVRSDQTTDDTSKGRLGSYSATRLRQTGVTSGNRESDPRPVTETL